jgi:hypothetical protein
MAKGGGWEIGGTTLQVAIVGIGALALYVAYQTFTTGQRAGTFVGGQLEGFEDWMAGGANRAVGAPQYYWRSFWMETTGAKGLGLTGESSGTGNPNLEKRRKEAKDKSYWRGEEGYIPDFIY